MALRRSPLANSGAAPHPRRLPTLLPLALALALSGLIPSPAQAFVRLDFEQNFFVHPQRQVWDFCLVRPDSVYHIFYHSILEATPYAAKGDTIWHATSLDLKRWDIQGPVLTVGTDWWDAGANWAPDVVYDEGAGLWRMLYTACDLQMNQRLAIASSPDLDTWSDDPGNPNLEPDPSKYLYNPAVGWSDFRDPFVYRQEGQWHVLITARKWLGQSTGVLYHASSPDLATWTDLGPIFANDGSTPGRVLESPQYHVIGDYHHLFFGEYDTPGITLLSNLDPAGWSMADRVTVDGGYAPEIKEFDPGHRVFARITPYYLPFSSDLGYVVRLDTLKAVETGALPWIFKHHPLDADWAHYTGICFNANPTFGDNPLWRGEPSVGLEGNSYFSSQEYYQGPLSGRGAPGVALGDAAVGNMDSRPFIVTGRRMDLLVGGGNYPETCYVALLSAADSTVLLRESGLDDPHMTLRTWNLAPFLGAECFIRIVDDETGPMGFINVDEIIESDDPVAGVGPDAPGLLLAGHQAAPNPFNPMTGIRFELSRPARVRIVITDVRGRTVWLGPEVEGRTGVNRLAWNGIDLKGTPAASGAYLYVIEIDGGPAGRGKLTLLR